MKRPLVREFSFVATRSCRGCTSIEERSLDLKLLLDERHTADPEVLTKYIRMNFGGTLLSLRQLEPYLRELRRRFKLLPRKSGVNGEFKTIDGQRFFKDWCPAVLHKSDRTVRHMLKTANTKTETATLAVQVQDPDVVASKILKYVQTKMAKLNQDEQQQVLVLLRNHFSWKDFSETEVETQSQK
jgi:hypothetical protein